MDNSSGKMVHITGETIVKGNERVMGSFLTQRIKVEVEVSGRTALYRVKDNM
jgi:hypothetical protein